MATNNATDGLEETTLETITVWYALGAASSLLGVATVVMFL